MLIRIVKVQNVFGDIKDFHKPLEEGLMHGKIQMGISTIKQCTPC